MSAPAKPRPTGLPVKPVDAPPTARQRALCVLIRAGRRTLAGTPFGGSRATSAVSAALHRSAFAGRSTAIPYRGLRFTTADGDRCVAPALLSGRHEALELDLYTSLLKGARGVVDVGASIGLYSCLGAAALPADGRITAFEPVPANVAALRRNLALNGCADRVHVEEAAVGPDPGTLTLHLSSVNSGGHSAAPDAEGGRTAVVRQVALDAYPFGRRPDFLKIDAEGYEVQVLRGATRTLREDRPAVLIEYVPERVRACGDDPADILRALREGGRTVYVVDKVCGVLRLADASVLAALAGVRGRHPHFDNLLSVVRPDQRALLPEGSGLTWSCAV
ncbi:FkbM family methyltransferase [Streptomyces sp. NBC_00237]|uniref:FkbM family methyltransferase n=1 Tax=Streptomyces sp. NBC_00237 TaxID=2975687 RepID=UPI0022515B93|nr:FkbM family methyltransferase [Streptomyces sp. NBC_00237]MCX5200260.1 FkbM family methyltransferase [Streptomyces sp. NBC_00237]